jgi:phosphohistidine phosphatase
MIIYLVQHGQAEPKERNPDRPLTVRGRQDTQAVADLAQRLGLEVRQIRHSGKTRAEETATILGEALGPADGVVAASGLGPLDDVKPVAKELSKVSQPVMLVGHLPFMQRLAGELIVGDSDSAPVKFQNSGIVCLTREDEDWQVAWIATPEMAGIRSPAAA